MLEVKVMLGGQGNAGGQVGQGNVKVLAGVDCPTGPKGTSGVELFN